MGRVINSQGTNWIQMHLMLIKLIKGISKHECLHIQSRRELQTYTVQKDLLTDSRNVLWGHSLTFVIVSQSGRHGRRQLLIFCNFRVSDGLSEIRGPTQLSASAERQKFTPPPPRWPDDERREVICKRGKDFFLLSCCACCIFVRVMGRRILAQNTI